MNPRMPYEQLQPINRLRAEVSRKKEYWESIYESKAPNKLSWTQARPEPSIDWILEVSPDRSSGIIDVGGGNACLVDFLLDKGYKRPAVLDISVTAMTQLKNRLGERQKWVEWIESDVTDFRSQRKYNVWHDRAVFHFLTNGYDRRGYIESLESALETNGKVILATFSPRGPHQCSGLDVMRFDSNGLARELGKGFDLIRHELRIHMTPWGAEQEFTYCLFTKNSSNN